MWWSTWPQAIWALAAWGERHGCLSWEGGSIPSPTKEPPGQKALSGLAYAVSAIHAFAGEADPDIFEVEGTTAAQKSHRIPICEPCGIFVPACSFGRRRAAGPHLADAYPISIHSVRVGIDRWYPARRPPSPSNFNPRPPCGNRRVSEKQMSSDIGFQSTIPIGRRPSPSLTFCFLVRFQSTPSLRTETANLHNIFGAFI